jgi:AcrR family transcriptional regulator
VTSVQSQGLTDSLPAKSKSRPRTKPPEQRRNELMNAAERLFLQHGVGSTTIAQIASAADIAKGTFYLYFSSKEHVLAALGDRYGHQLLVKIKAAIEKKRAQDWTGKLGAWARACLTGYLDSIRLHDILFYGSHPPTREGLVDNILIDYLFDLLRAGVEARAWSLDDPRFTAVFLFSGLHGVVDDAHVREKRANRGRLAHRMKRLCFRAVGLPLA